MSLLQNRMKSQKENQQKITDKVNNQIINPDIEEQKLLETIQQLVAETYRDTIAKNGITYDTEKGIKEIIRKVAESNNLDFEAEKRIEKIVLNRLTGLGPIESFRSDPTITEIIVERYDKICIEKDGIVYATEAKFSNEEELVGVINRIIAPTGRAINIAMPMVDSRLSDGSRINATIPPVTPDGATLTIRKYSNKMLTGQNYIDNNSLSSDMLIFLQKCVKGRLAIIVSGGTGAGKTSLLNMLSQSIPSNELIVTIEDSLELNLQQPHVRRMEARVSMNNETNAVLMPITPQTMVKNNSPENLVDSRLPILFSMNKDAEFSEATQKLLFKESIDLIVQISRMPDHSRKITKITHISEDKNGNMMLKDVFVYSKSKEQFEATGYIPQRLITKLQLNGVSMETDIFKKRSDEN